MIRQLQDANNLLLPKLVHARNTHCIDSRQLLRQLHHDSYEKGKSQVGTSQQLQLANLSNE